MDGNGRWARKRGLPRSAGHKAGTEATKSIVTECRKLGIPYLTLYAFSRENWGRPRDEVNFLFDLLVRFLKQELADLVEQSIRLNVIGDVSGLPRTVQMALGHAGKKTAKGEAMVLTLALNYSGREEILQACRSLLAEATKPDELTEEMFRSRLYTGTGDIPDPDLVVRTSGEQRLSNYLLFQSAYSELYFTPVLWPDFDEQALHTALDDFASRKRRFGLTGEQ